MHTREHELEGQPGEAGSGSHVEHTAMILDGSGQDPGDG